MIQDISTLLASIPVLIIVYHILSYFLDPQGIRAIPGSFLAKFSDAWLAWTSAHGRRSEVVHELHKKLGWSQSLACT